MKKYCFIDYEFRGFNERFLNVVSVSYETTEGEKETIWLYKDEQAQEDHIDRMVELRDEGYIFVAYAVTAEARCFETLLTKFGWDLKAWDFQWIDLYLEWRMILNHNSKYTLGKHLVGGKVVDIQDRKKWRSDVKAFKAEYGMGACVFKLLGEKIDTKRKNQVRDIIIKGENLGRHIDEILEYNESDIEYLPRTLEKILEVYKDEFEPEDYDRQVNKSMFSRSDYAARTAEMEAFGYPCDYTSTKSFSDSVPVILFRLQKEINELFPDIEPFKLDVKKGRYSWNQIATRKWVAKSPYRNKWRMTDGGKKNIPAYSLSRDAFSDHFHARHEFPKDCFGSQIKRYLTFKQNLNGFLPAGKGKNSFWDSVGSDRRVRPYMGIYGSQSSRSQPKATGFLFLKSAWMRSLCMPDAGRACTGIDYKSEEFLLGALMATRTFKGKAEGDANMIEAYYSGDPYSWFAKAAGAMPKNGSKETHPEIRDAFKSTVLALQYDMGDESLAAKLTADTGKKWTVAQAARQSSMFKRVFSDFIFFRKRFVMFGQQNYQMSWDGWTLFPDNPNPLSIGNWPIQTMGAVIMREAVRMAQDQGLQVIFTLHDALYIEHGSNDYMAPKKLSECMQKAFQLCMNTDRKIGLDIDCWSSDYERKFEEIKETYKSHGVDCAVKGKYIDPRGKKEYESFKQYFTNELEEV